MDAVEVSALHKRYGKVDALRGIDLRVAEGSVFGLVGPNGAGKTTLIKALVGALRPTSGAVRVLGLDPLADRARLRRQIGYMPQFPVLYNDLSARDNIAFFGAAHGRRDLRRRVDEVLEFTDLNARADDAVHTFSGGMRHRVSLACALVHRPQMLLLDEPSAGVDPQLRSRFWQEFRELARAGTTLFISTHLMEEAMLCDRIAILRQGKVLALDAPRQIIQKGRALLRIGSDGQEERVAVGGRPEDLADALHAYGLSREIDRVSVEAESLESVILSMIAGDEAA